MYIAVGDIEGKKYWCGYGFTKKSCKRQALRFIRFVTDSYIHLSFEQSDFIPFELPFIFDRANKSKIERLMS